MRLAPLLFALLLIGCSSELPEIDQIVFEDLDGQEVKLNFNSTSATVVYFLSPECPLCINYTKAMREIEEQFNSDSVSFYGVHSAEWFSADEVREYQLKYGLQFPMLMDDGNQLAHCLGATITPEVFVFNQEGKVVYSGKIDNWVNDLGKKKLEVSEKYLEDAIVATLNAKPTDPAKTKAIGCLIE